MPTTQALLNLQNSFWTGEPEEIAKIAIALLKQSLPDEALEDLALQVAGDIHRFLREQSEEFRPLAGSDSEIEAIWEFARFFVREVFAGQYSADPAILTENEELFLGGLRFAAKL